MNPPLSSSLVVQTSFLGDVILTTPLISALAARGPVDVVTTPTGAPLLANNPAIRAVIAYDKRGADAGIGGLLRLGGRLRAAQYDAAYLAQGSWRSAALAVTARVGKRVGFSTSAGRFLYTQRITPGRDSHHAERLWRLAAGMSAPKPSPASIRPRLFPDDAARSEVTALLARTPRDGATLIALAPGSVWATKRWPHYAALAARLAPLHRIVVLGSGADAALAAEIAAAVGAERCIDATGRLSLLASAALLEMCAGVVTNDSAPLHLASAMGTPTVAIFGPTVPAFGFGPLSERQAIVQTDGLDCRPCDSHGPQRCPLSHWKCMQELRVQLVMDAVLSTTTP
ncbi:MAG: lipopolysaccharide heptosyltransferase II [Gemmatimonadetes bacterium]|nr:lipopolysaccharide heptosyltransferase II [Gemmatimonadota bacterium]